MSGFRLKTSFSDRQHTALLVLSYCLVVLSAQLGPSRELVLRADSIHLTLQAHHLCTQLCCFLRILRGRGRQFAVECP